MDALRAFLRRLLADQPAAQRVLVQQREAARLGIEAEAWQEICASPVDLELLRAAHRAVIGDQANVRRTRGDGEWDLAASRPGLLRTKPQAFRVGSHVEPAWDQAELKSRLTRLFRDVAEPTTDPVDQAARLLWALSRAQPFAGGNERTALVMVSRWLRQVDLPVLCAVEAERDPDFTAALAAATPTDRSALERYLATAVWDEALGLVEGLAPSPPDARRWTLQDEHRALEQARTLARHDTAERIEWFAARAAEALVPELTARLGAAPCLREPHRPDSQPERLQVAWDSGLRGRLICPHQPILVLRWDVGAGLGLEAKLILGGAGRGISGAVSAHLALELADLPAAAPAPAMLLLPDDTDSDRVRRLAAWIGAAVARVIRSSPLRV